MSQQVVIKVLEKNKDKWMTSKQIGECVDVGASSVSVCLKKLYKQGAVFRKSSFKTDYKWSNKGGIPYLWKIKD